MMKPILSAMALAAVAACTAPNPAATTTSHTSTPPTHLQQQWKLIQFQTFQPKELTQSILDLRQLPRAYATVGCNGMNFQAATNAPNLWQVQGVAMTRMHCPDVAKLEMAFAKQIQAATHYRLENNRLILQDDKGSTMVFEATN
ncbi:META domain-containing protein [Alysiella filiformis]|uniref:Heat shock protein HslJ n=1 Tax=Alysiella filiformis DSM 16848 TaxID=1120981 RepID=A0A286E382_9NEIS|nr:META domain-containing protein [Alysiella filiformis]QMT31127.1 META domain-containing protein [Alysiella filiformis]UBQ55881.1 META domain-containing protein [Alysiella filiformis DSM 16848]SOD65353.1 Heat shock protein HslJ [Alysiella filiformis DSM 16848]